MELAKGFLKSATKEEIALAKKLIREDMAAQLVRLNPETMTWEPCGKGRDVFK